MTLFYLSLLASFVSTTIIAVVVYFGGRKSWSWLVIVPFALIVMTWSTSLAVAIHLPAALVAFWGYQQSKWGYAAFLGIVTTTLAGSYVIVCSVSYLEIESYRKRRESYAQELLAERLPPAQMSMGEKKLPEGSKRRLEITADKVGRVLNEDHRRTMALLNLHERRMEKFVNASGFGVRRIIAVPTEERVKPPDLAEPILQPGTRDELQWSDSNLAKESGHTQEDDFVEMHLDSIVDFVNPRGFGYVSPEKQLFGFQPHHFRKIPASNRWQVRSVELVSLILNKEPKVYVTVELPRMDKVRNVPTRALDEFEKTGLSKLRSGDDLFVCETPVGIRMLGAIRSLKLCVECHDGEPGNLLGAFSYGLVPR